jgi:hypothetical protein
VDACVEIGRVWLARLLPGTCFRGRRVTTREATGYWLGLDAADSAGTSGSEGTAQPASKLRRASKAVVGSAAEYVVVTESSAWIVLSGITHIE